jgi:hypothetical protein
MADERQQRLTLPTAAEQAANPWGSSVARSTIKRTIALTTSVQASGPEAVVLAL